MPATQTVPTVESTEMPAQNPTVVLAGASYPPGFINCLSAERRLGVAPGQAMFRIDKALEQASPITLNASRNESGYSQVGDLGCRVRVQIDGEDIWRGWLTRREDNGAEDTVLWTAYEDQWLLSKIFLRGCYVLDPVDAVVKFVKSFTPLLNPDGLWNCIYHHDVDYIDPVSGEKVPIWVPVFAPQAKLIMNYDSPEQTTVGPDALEGEYCAWTPRRLLQYLCYCLSYQHTAPRTPFIAGADEGLVRMDPRILAWDYSDIIGLTGYDPATTATNDPLDLKLPSINLQGVTFAAALDQVLQIAGTHEATFLWPSASSEAASMATQIFFSPTRWSADKASQGRVLLMPRGGSVESVKHACSFSVSESIDNYVDTVVVEGEPVKVETSLFFMKDPANPTNPILGWVNKPDANTSALVPAWTEAEELAWRACVSGSNNPTDAPVIYARYPKVPGDANMANFVNANGADSSTPLVPARGALAAKLAWDSFPTVWRAFKINPTVLEADGIFNGWDNKMYADKVKYPRLSYNRPLYPQQLQYLIQSLGLDSTQQANWIRGGLPVRLTIFMDDGTSHFYDAQLQNLVRVSGDGLLWLDAVSMSATSNFETIVGVPDGGDYNSMDWLAPWLYRLRNFTINAAIPLDWRVFATATNKRSPEDGGVADTLRNAFGGQVIAYYDDIQDFQERHQIHSQPTCNPEYAGKMPDGSPVAYPLTRLLPPGSEQYSAKNHAERRLRFLNIASKDSTWKIPGINLDWLPGEYLKELKPLNSDEKPYPIRAAIPRVLWDFVAQYTELGGLQSAFAT